MIKIYQEFKQQQAAIIDLKSEVSFLSQKLNEAECENAALKGKLALTDDPTIIQELQYQLEQAHKENKIEREKLYTIQQRVRELFLL